MICCGQWGVNDTGYFGGQNMTANLADVQALGLGVQPLGMVSNLALMSRSWKDTDAVAKAVEWASTPRPPGDPSVTPRKVRRVPKSGQLSD